MHVKCTSDVVLYTRYCNSALSMFPANPGHKGDEKWKNIAVVDMSLGTVTSCQEHVCRWMLVERGSVGQVIIWVFSIIPCACEWKRLVKHTVCFVLDVLKVALTFSSWQMWVWYRLIPPCSDTACEQWDGSLYGSRKREGGEVREKGEKGIAIEGHFHKTWTASSTQHLNALS